MNTRVLQLAAVLIGVLGIGIVGAMSFGGFAKAGAYAGLWHQGNYTSGNYAQGSYIRGNWTKGNYTSGNWTIGNWTGGNYTVGKRIKGNYTGGNSFKFPLNRTSYNATSIARQQAAQAQCKTTFADSAAGIVYSDLGIAINTSQINAANANLQANASSNASSWYTAMSESIFNNAIEGAYLKAMLALHGLNQTQLQALKADLNATKASLGTCISSNSTAPMAPIRQASGGFGEIGAGVQARGNGFAAGVGHGFGAGQGRR